MMACTAWMMSGCATTPTPPEPPSPVQPSKPGSTKPAIAPKTVVPPLEAPSAEQDPKGRAQKLALHAVQMLQTGADGTAQAELQEAVRLDPDNKIAQSLLRQTMVDPVATLGSRHFLYTVRPDDTLSKIAQRFLGDLYQFYILARYNNIQNPSQLEVGTVIKIPGNAPASASAPVPATVPPTPPVPPEFPPPVSKPKADAKTLAEARKLMQRGAYSQAIEFLQRKLQELPDDQPAEDLLVSAYLGYAKQLREQGNEDEAKQQLQKALAMQPDNTKVNAQLREMESGSRVERVYQSGLQALQKGEQEKAYAVFTEALKLNPRHAQAAQKAEEVKQDMIQRYHKNAMGAFHRQDLDSAIKEWDKILVLSPDNESARLNRARAVELRKRIQKFGK